MGYKRPATTRRSLTDARKHVMLRIRISMLPSAQFLVVKSNITQPTSINKVFFTYR